MTTLAIRRWFTATKLVGLVLGVVACIAVVAWDGPLRDDAGSKPAIAAGIAALMAIWWISEALPIHWTACVPLIAFPVARVFEGGSAANAQQTIARYADPYVFLFMGGMGIGAAMQQWNLHRRIALAIMSRIGTDPRRLLAGVLVSTAFVSLWISNTATASMMMPIGVALIVQLELNLGGRRLEHFGAAIMLAIAYGANVGGIGTKIGTAPNAQLAGFLAAKGIPVSFLEFLVIGSGFVALFLPAVWLVLWRVARRDPMDSGAAKSAISEERRKLGPMRRGEWIVLAVFLAAVVAWIASGPIHAALARRIDGLRTSHVEGAIAMLAVAVLIFARASGQPVLAFASLRRIPWSALILLGGGFALAGAVESSGLSRAIAASAEGVRELSTFQAVLVASASTIAISAVCSNSATIGIMLPVFWGAVARADATTVLFAATIGSSCDFALPAGTPPNAIVFGSGYVTIPRMIRTGVVLDVLAALVAAVWCSLVVRVVL